MKHRFSAEENGTLSEMISARFAGVPAAVVKRLIKQGEVRVAGVKAAPGASVKAGEEISVYLPEKWDTPASPVTVYADENIVVADKPVLTDVETHLTAQLSAVYGEVFPAHRLDRNTTGLVMFARTSAALASLTDAIKNRRTDKYYKARVFGRPPKEEDTLTAYLFKDAERAYCRVSDTPREGWLEIRTAYRLLSADGETSLLEVRLLTGRTHQIRAHLAHIGCPVVGDRKYGDPAQKERYQQLRAYKIVLGELNPPLSYLSGRSFEI